MLEIEFSKAPYNFDILIYTEKKKKGVAAMQKMEEKDVVEGFIFPSDGIEADDDRDYTIDINQMLLPEGKLPKVSKGQFNFSFHQGAFNVSFF